VADAIIKAYGSYSLDEDQPNRARALEAAQAGSPKELPLVGQSCGGKFPAAEVLNRQPAAVFSPRYRAICNQIGGASCPNTPSLQRHRKSQTGWERIPARVSRD
jgi:hypothetical protein